MTNLPKRRTRIFDDDRHRDLFLSAIRSGCTRIEALKVVGASPRTFYQYIKDYPEFGEQVVEAEADQVEGAYSYLLQVLNDEEAETRDRITAADKLIKNRGRNRAQSAQHYVKHTHEITIGGNMEAEFVELHRKIQAIEATVTEET